VIGADVKVVVNPVAGDGRRQRRVRILVRELIGLGLRVRVCVTSSVDELQTSVRQAVSTNVRCIVIAGGDGTWHAALPAAAHTGIPVVLLPTGTGDDNARHLRWRHLDPGALARAIARGDTREIDLGLAELNDDSHYFSGVLSIGFDSRVNARANEYRQLPGTLRYLVAAAAELRAFSPVDCLIQTHEGDLQVRAMMIAVGNGSHYGGGMAICPAADSTDGYLDLTIVHESSVPVFLSALPGVYRGRHVHRPTVSVLRASEASIRCIDQLVYADGEPLGTTPVRVSCVPRALTVITAEESP
jgi:diacylglycerol kinase (ATP)